MKRLLTLFCALLGFGAMTFAGEPVYTGGQVNINGDGTDVVKFMSAFKDVTTEGLVLTVSVYANSSSVTSVESLLEIGFWYQYNSATYDGVWLTTQFDLNKSGAFATTGAGLIENEESFPENWEDYTEYATMLYHTDMLTAFKGAFDEANGIASNAYGSWNPANITNMQIQIKDYETVDAYIVGCVFAYAGDGNSGTLSDCISYYFEEDDDDDVEYGWTLITDQVSLEYGTFTKIAWEDLGNATQICIVATCSDPSSQYTSYKNFGGIYYNESWGIIEEYAYAEEIKETYTFTYTVTELVEDANTTDGFYLCFYGPTTSVKVYGYGIIESTEGGDSPEGYAAGLQFSAADWYPGVSAKDGSATLTYITESGTYSVVEESALAGTSGLICFCVDILGLKTDYPNATATLKSITVDGEEVEFVAENVIVGDIEENGNLRIEIYNDYGDTQYAPALANKDAFAIETSIAVEFDVEFEPETGGSDTGSGAGSSGDPAAISEVQTAVEAVEVARYNVAGQKISGETKGINIIKYSDGSTKKVLVK